MMNDEWQTAFYMVLGILNGGMAALLAYLAKTNIDLQKAVASMNESIEGILNRDIQDFRKRQHSIESRVTQLEHDFIRAGIGS